VAADVRLELPRRRRSLVSLTPLIDVVFILLLFFMLTTQFDRRQAMTLSVPVSGSAAVPAETESLVLALGSDGRVALDGEGSVELRTLGRQALVSEARTLGTPVVVVVVAEDEVDLQTFTRLMDTLAALGFVDVAVHGLR